MSSGPNPKHPTLFTNCPPFAGCSHSRHDLPFRTLRPDAPGWKVETEGAYSLHLCPAHRHKSWLAVREAQAAAADGPTTERF
jgi:hypothetical protein